MIELQPIYGIEEANRWATAEEAINLEENSCFDEAIQTPISPSSSSFPLDFPKCTTVAHPSPDGSVAFLSLSPNSPIPCNSSFTIPSSLSRSNPAFYDYGYDSGHTGFRSWDTDSDGVTDFDEFQNSSNPLLLDTDSDHVPDFREDAGNLTMTSGGDPEIVDKIEAHFTYHWKGITIEKITITVTVHVRDDAGLDYAKAKCEGAGGWKYNSLAETESLTITTLDGKERTFDNVPVKEAVTVFEGYNADFTGAFLTGYDIEIEVGDVNGYGVKGGAHLDGIVEGWVKAALKWLEAMVKALTELLASMFNWIWNKIKNLLDFVLKPIWDSINNYVNKIYEVISNFFKNPIVNTEQSEKLSKAFFGASPSLFLAISVLSGVVQIIELLLFVVVTIVSGGTVSAFIAFIKECITSAIKSAIEHWIGISIGLTLGLIIGAIAGYFVPATSTNTALIAGISLIISLIVLTLQFATTKNKISLKGITGDLCGLSLAIVGFFITLVIIQKADWNLANTILGVLGIIFAGLGLFIGLASTSELDGTTFGFLDETVSAGLFGYAIASTITSALK